MEEEKTLEQLKAELADLKKKNETNEGLYKYYSNKSERQAKKIEQLTAILEAALALIKNDNG